jgi:hypothetical protein
MGDVCDGCHVDPVHAPRLYEGPRGPLLPRVL